MSRILLLFVSMARLTSPDRFTSYLESMCDCTLCVLARCHHGDRKMFCVCILRKRGKDLHQIIKRRRSTSDPWWKNSSLAVVLKVAFALLNPGFDVVVCESSAPFMRAPLVCTSLHNGA